VPGFRGGDRIRLDLPDVQEQLLKDVHALGKPVVLVLLNGSAVAVNWAHTHVPAIVDIWYPGQAAGTALADVLFGDANPAGRLPVTFYKSVEQLPPFEDYAMAGRTYRYFTGEPLYPFGYGLSYTRFRYNALRLPKQAPVGRDVDVSVEVRNEGPVAGEEVVQVYLTDESAGVPVPLRALKGFRRIRLMPGEKKTVRFVLKEADFSLIDARYRRVVEPGRYRVAVGGCQPVRYDHLKQETTEFKTGRIDLVGSVKILEPGKLTPSR
jgi:beta-glucosidase